MADETPPDPSVSGAIPAAVLAAAAAEAERIERYQQMSEFFKHTPGWVLWRWKQNPFLLTTALTGFLTASVWMVDTGLPQYAGIKAEQYPFFTQYQGQRLACEVRVVGHDTCTLLVAVGQRDAGDCGDPPSCPDSPA